MLLFKKIKYKRIIKEAEDYRNIGELEKARDKYLEAFNDLINLGDYMNLASIYIDLKQFDKAIQIFEEIKEMANGEEGMADVYFGLGLCHDSLKQVDLAILNYEEAIERGCKIPECFYFLAYIYDEMEKGKDDVETKKAFKYYNKAIKLYPNYLFAYVNLGNLYAKFNERDEALKYYLKAKELDEHHDASCDYNLGVCYSNLGEMEKAEYYYLEELKTENPYIGTFYNLGILYKDKKEYDKSINYYLKALEKDKEDFNVWYNLACVYALKGDFDNAFSCLTYIKYNKPTWLEGTKTDEELDTLRKDSRYQQLFEK